jgi:hypothetical protein
MVCCINSYQSTRGHIRWRVYIPTTTILSPKLYKNITKLIKSTLSESGFKNLLDRGKLHPASLFYLPCRATDPDGSFFREFKGDGREALNPLQWIEEHFGSIESIEPLDANVFDFPRQGRDDERIREAIEEWRQSVSYPGEGNDRFFRLAVGLAKAGMPEHEMQATLMEEAALGRSPDKRRRQIPSIISSLWDYGHFSGGLSEAA